MATRFQYQIKSADGSTSYKDFLSGAGSKVDYVSSIEDDDIIEIAKKYQAISTGRLTGKFRKVVTTEFDTPSSTFDTIPSAVSDLTEIEGVTNLTGYVNIENTEGKSYDLKYGTMALGTASTLTANYSAFGEALAAKIDDYDYIETGAGGKYRKTLQQG